MPPYLSLALGSVEATLCDMTSAYSAFPNQGVRMQPYSVVSIADRDGNVLEENRPRAARSHPRRHGVRHDQPAARRGAARHGAAAAALDWPLAGKTGTMDEYTDAWFIGFDPNITVGVWVGYDEKKPLGTQRNRRDRSAPHLDRLHEGLHRHARRSEESARVRGARQHRLRDARFGITEAFINGTQPGGEESVTPAASVDTPPAPVAPAAQ